MPKKKRIADKNERLPSPMFDMGTMPYIEIDDIRKRSLPVDEEERGFGVRY